jgi:glycosyltransferase involved in cell wall biosynthesis
MLKRPLRVSFLIDRLDTAGTETQLLALIAGLDRTRVEPSLVLLDGTDERSRSLEPADCPIVRLGLKRFRDLETPRRLWQLARFWRSWRPDVVQVYFIDSTYVGVPIARLCGIKRVVRVRNNLGYWLKSRSHAALGRLYGRLVDATLTNSDAGRDALLAAERGSRRSLVVLENGVDLEQFAPGPPPNTARPSTVRIGAVANLRPVKGLDLLVGAASRLQDDRRLQFTVAGEGPERPRLETLIAEQGLGERFTLPGATTDVPTFLQRLDVAVLCSCSEGMSNALLEAMATGRAIVATDVGANRRLLMDGACGVIVPPGDALALAAALRELIAEPVRARTLGQKARKVVEEQYGRPAMVRRFEAFYERLAG